MSKKKKDELKEFDYAPCECCEQTTQYPLALDRGTAKIVTAFAVKIREKGINVVHPTNEMERPKGEARYREGTLTSNQIHNISRGRRHGLLAQVKKVGGEHINRGNWCLTTKGADFLRGACVPRYSIVSKVTKHQEGYFEPEKYQVTVQELLKETEEWDGFDFEIVAGEVIKALPKKADNQNGLFPATA
jgi:hypothetical protein